MAKWNNFLEGVRGSKKRKKDPSEIFSEPFLMKFTPGQMDFIKEKAEIYGSKTNVVRVALKRLMKDKPLD